MSATHDTEGKLPTGLIRRGARYSIRRRVPLDLLGHYGKAEIIRALGTSDPKEARVRLAVEWVKLDTEFERLRRVRPKPALTAPKPARRGPDAYERMSREQFDDEMERLEFLAAEDRQEEAEYDARAEARDALVAAMSSGATVAANPAAMADLLRDQAFEAAVANERLQARLAMRPTSRASDNASTENFLPVAQSPTLESIIDKWARERQVSPKGIVDHRSVARWFKARVGNLPIGEVTKLHVIQFKDRLIEEGISQANIKTKLSRLRTLFSYAASNAIRADNPAEGVTVIVKDADARKRPIFDLPALKRIFGSPIYREEHRPVQGRGEAAYWLPLLALYTGARLEELGQLRPQDVCLETYPTEGEAQASSWFIHICQDEEDGLKLKNAGSRRLVPLHSVLVSNGFVEFAEAARSAQAPRLFTELQPNAYGRLTAKWGEWFSVYRREQCGVPDAMVFHSFRHTFKHWARHAGINEGVQRQIMGHSSSDVADSYGSGYSHFALVQGMDRFTIPGFTPPVPPRSVTLSAASE